MKKIGYAGLSTVLCLAFALPVMAQAPAEQACNSKYGSYYAAQTKFELGTAFLDDATCKDNMYREGTFQLMAGKLTEGSKFKETLELATRYGKDYPNAKTPYVYQKALEAASQLGDVDKIIEMGEKVLSIDPKDLNATLIVSTTIPEKLQTQLDPATKEKLLKRADELAKQLLATAKPAPIADATWQTAVMGPSHGVVGFVHLQRLMYPEAAAEYEQAVKINPKDQLSWFRLGLADTQIASATQKGIQPAFDAVNAFTAAGPERDEAIAKKDAIVKEFGEKRDKAIKDLISAVALGDPIGKSARVTLESLYNPLHDGKPEGLDELIAARKAELMK